MPYLSDPRGGMVDNLPPVPSILGVVIAGGRATRLGDQGRGGDKCLIELAGAPLLAHVLARLTPQVAATILNANGDAARFAAYDLPVVADRESGQGPLAGVIAGLATAEQRGLSYCLTVPGDAPLLPRDLAARLARAMGKENCAVARCGDQRQSLFALWRTSALPRVRQLYADGARALWRAQTALDAAEAVFAPDEADGFASLNRPEDRTVLATALARAGR